MQKSKKLYKNLKSLREKHWRVGGRGLILFTVLRTVREIVVPDIRIPKHRVVCSCFYMYLLLIVWKLFLEYM